MTGAVIGIAITVLVVSWAVHRLQNYPPVVIIGAAASFGMLWATGSIGVFIIATAAAGIIGAIVDAAAARDPKGD
jgi:hypothetical protein